MDIKEIVTGLTQEMRRGTIIIGLLSQLSEPQYGYSLVSTLEEKGINTNETRPRKPYRAAFRGLL